MDQSGAGPLPDEQETDSVYDDLLLKAAHAPSVDPERLKQMVQRSQQSLVGQTLAHFKVLERLGAGGMGVVYRAEDERLRRTVALKVLSAQLQDERWNQWLLREARSAAAVGHPNVAAVYEVGEAQGLAFIAMEYVEGQSLRALVGERGLPVGQALPLAAQIARGMARAHQGGVVHRDLKPDNVMVGPDGLVKLLDFGLALPLSALEQEGRGDGPPGVGRAVGTAAYMSPEQARGAAVDARSDVYSFGVMLFEMLAGRRPRGGAVVREEVLALAPAGAPAELVEALRRLLGRCLEPRPEERYPDGTALEEALQGLPAAGPSPGRRRRSWPLVVGGLALAAVGGYVVRHSGILPEPPPPEVHERRLTANPPENLLVDAALSPDGKTLAYTDQRGLFLRSIDLERTEPLRLPEKHNPELVSWFPAGDELLVTSSEPGSRLKRLWRIRIATGEARQLGTGLYFSIRVSPEGGRLVWSDYREIRIGPVDLSSSRVIASAREHENLTKPCWSPDGKRIAYVRDSLVTAALETASLETRERQVLLETPRLMNELGESALAWTASGELVYALCELPPKEVGFSLWRQAVDPKSGKTEGRPRLLHGWSGFYPDLLTVSGNGSLALARFETQKDVYVAELSDGGRRMSQPRRFTLSERNELPGSWTPDGQTLLFSSDRDGPNDIFLQKLDGSPARKLAAGPDFKTWPVVTPSGDGVLFWRYPWPPDERPRHAELVRFSLPAGSAVPVLTSRSVSGWTWDMSAPFNAHFRCASRGGGNCVLGEQEGGLLVFSTLDLRLGRGAELGRIQAPNDLHGWDLSPDGRRIALPGQRGELRVWEISSRELSHRIVAPGCQLTRVVWSADGSAIFAAASCEEARVLSKILYIGPERAADVLWTQDSSWLSSPLPSPDGKHLAIAVQPLKNDIWLVTGF